METTRQLAKFQNTTIIKENSNGVAFPVRTSLQWETESLCGIVKRLWGMGASLLTVLGEPQLSEINGHSQGAWGPSSGEGGRV